MSARAERQRAIVSIWFPNLAIERWKKALAQQGETAEAEKPTALVTETAHGPLIDHVTPEAREAGAQPGMRLADARMLYPALIAVPSDPEGDARLLERMALAAQRWGPWSAPDKPSGIVLDVSGAAHLAGGEAALLEAVEARFAALGYTARTALAPTAAAAWALSHYGLARTIVRDASSAEEAVAPLPVAALRLAPDTLTLLRRLGFRTVRDLLAVPRESLVRRFRDRRFVQGNPLIRLDQLSGRLHDPLVPIVHTPPPQAQRRLMEPLLHTEPLKIVIADLAQDLVRLLEERQTGARRLSLILWRIDGMPIERQVELASPSRDAKHIANLFEERLDIIDAGFGIDVARLVAVWTQSLEEAQADLAGPGGETDAAEIAPLIDRLVTRLGSRAVRRPHPRASHLPERAQSWRAASSQPAEMQYGFGFHRRPLKLLDRAEPIAVIYATPEGLPRRFRWRGALHDIAKVEGPERIAPEWWRERSHVRLRDYYRIEDDRGRRYWIYRSGLIGDGRGDVPDWYLHGLFA
ncbi:DUF6504 family protein [Qipengyuania atrilutea]|uniref:DNA-directed DNA polymerase n=1 Tax=Qipengyuania atrilutea TaxID=2744473 RepID=A0A850H7I7_9SPHN|nr:DUF6504 family protein [Actirhodobacter atriluteus]NVD45763.1 DNA polymerase Y family protein [Actirhodobacter atriluteus]